MGYTIANAGQAPRYFKIIATGTAGAGKTRFALDGGTFDITADGKLKGKGELWPDLLVINAESGVNAYEESMENMFRIIHTNKISVLSEVVNDIYSGKLTCGTLLVDTYTTFNQVVREVAEQQAKGEMSFKEWGKVNRTMQNVQNKLAMLPCHVILVVHESEVIETGKGETTRQGFNNQDGKVKLAANKTVAQWADFILWFQPRVSKGTRVKVHKARGVYLGEDANLMLDNPSWQKTFKPVAERWAKRGGDTVKLDEVQAHKDAEQVIEDNDGTAEMPVTKKVPAPPQTFTNLNAVRRWIQKWTREPYSLSPEQVCQMLGAEKFSDAVLADMTFEEADRTITQAIAERQDA